MIFPEVRYLKELNNGGGLMLAGHEEKAKDGRWQLLPAGHLALGFCNDRVGVTWLDHSSPHNHSSQGPRPPGWREKTAEETRHGTRNPVLKFSCDEV